MEGEEKDRNEIDREETGPCARLQVSFTSCAYSNNAFVSFDLPVIGTSTTEGAATYLLRLAPLWW
jgi:hypothetical protein